MNEKFRTDCLNAINSLCSLAEYTEDGERELTATEIQWLAVVYLSYQKAMAGEVDDDSDFRVDGTIY